MPKLHLAFFVLALSLPISVLDARGDDLDRALTQLSSPDARDRWEGERWLGAHLTPADRARVLRVAEGSGAEVRRRLARAIGEVDRRLAWTAGLLLDRRPWVRELGEQALALRLSLWDPEVAEHGITGNDLMYELLDTARRSPPVTLRLPVLEDLGATCALLARQGDLPLGLLVDPAVATRKARAGDAARSDLQLEGTWDELVRGLAALFRVGVEGFGLRAGEDGPEPYAFLRFCPPVEAGQRTPVELMGAWIRAVTGDGSPDRRVAAARALGQSGWPEVLDWLADRGLGDRGPHDRAALEGVLHAASSGRVALALLRGDVQRRLLGRLGARGPAVDGADRDLAIAVVDAFRALPPVSAAGDRGLGDLLAEGLETATPFERWARLAILEGTGSSAGAGPARRLLAAPGLGRGTLQALRTLAACRGGATGQPEDETVVADLATLLSGCRTTEDALEVGRLLAAVRARLPEGRSSSEAPLAGRVALLLARLQRGEVEEAARLWRELPLDRASAGEMCGEALLGLRAGGTSLRTLRTAWRLARGDASLGRARAALDRSAVLGGIVPTSELEDVARPLVSGDGPDWALLGSLAGVPGERIGEDCRRRLADAFRQALEDGGGASTHGPLLAAIERATGDLRARELLPSGAGSPPEGGADASSLSRAETWRRELRSLLLTHALSGPGGAPRSKLAAGLGAAWPPPRPARVRDLARRDRRPENPE